MWKLNLCLIVGLMLPATAAAKPWYKSARWWLGEAVIAAALAADAHSTSRAQPFAVERNPLLGHHPSNSQIAGWAIADFALLSTAHAAAWHATREHRKLRRFAPFAVPAYAAAVNGRAAALNYQLRSGQ